MPGSEVTNVCGAPFGHELATGVVFAVLAVLLAPVLEHATAVTARSAIAGAAKKLLFTGTP